jgi:hypothetical protein
MKKALNISIIVCLTLLAYLVIGHLKNEVYYVIQDSNDRFLNIEKDKTKIHLSIEPRVNGLVYSVTFYEIQPGLTIDTINILASKNKRYLDYKDKPFNPEINSKTTFRSFSRRFNFNNDTSKANYNFELQLIYSENGKTYDLSFNKPISRKTKYRIYYGDMHDPTRIIIPFLTYVLLILFFLRIIYWIRNKRHNTH